MAEWLRSGLQIRAHRFDSGRRLQTSQAERVGLAARQHRHHRLRQYQRAYLTAAQAFPVLDVRAVADIDPAAAERRGAEFGVPASGIAELLADPAVEIVLNLTIPSGACRGGRQVVAAGKHVYSEKPLGIALRRGGGLRWPRRSGAGCGSAARRTPSSAASHQTCRELIDAGHLGAPVGGTAFFMCPGHERWHPNPDFYYKARRRADARHGALLRHRSRQPARAGGAGRGAWRRGRVGRGRSPAQPRAGELIPVEVPTHVARQLEFRSGAVVSVIMSFDVPGAPASADRDLRHRGRACRCRIRTGSAARSRSLPKGGEWAAVPVELPWMPTPTIARIGLADMAPAIRRGRPHRASGALALHVLEVMEAFGRSAESGRFVDIATRPERPAPLVGDAAPLDRLEETA